MNLWKLFFSQYWNFSSFHKIGVCEINPIQFIPYIINIPMASIGIELMATPPIVAPV
jgi:hypothetical protein